MAPSEHNKLLGILYLVQGGLHVIGMLFMLVFLPIFFSTIPETRNADFPRGIFVGIMIFAVVIYIIFAIPPLLAAYGLLKRKAWSRTAGIFAAIVALLNMPLGTALGIYTLWFLFSEEGKRFYLYGGEQSYLPPPPPSPQGWQ